MNRRQFLRVLPAAAAGLALTDPTKLAPAPLQFHPKAVAMAMAPLETPLQRFDILFGWATLRPEFACRVVGDELEVMRREARIVPVPLPEKDCAPVLVIDGSDDQGPWRIYDYTGGVTDGDHERNDARHHLQIRSAAITREPERAVLQD